MGNSQGSAARLANDRINQIFGLRDEKESVHQLKSLIEEGKITEEILSLLPIENAACRDDQRINTSIALVCTVSSSLR